MSDEIKTEGRRPYRKRRRAELEDETRLRITEAAVDLHGTVGPAKTTISAIAERAGVQRATVYRHFPDEETLFSACSSLWATRNPPPDPESWAEIADPDERLRTALGQLFAWYRRTESMQVNVNRDIELMPVTDAAREFMRLFETAGEILVRGRRERGARRRLVAAAIGHALAFVTWRSLVREQGLSDAEAIDLLAGLVGAAGLARR